MSCSPPDAIVVLLAKNVPATQALTLLIKDWDFTPVVGESISDILAILVGQDHKVVAIVADAEIAVDNDGAAFTAALIDALGRPVPTILMTSHFMGEFEPDNRVSRATVLAKPFDPETLHEALTDVVSRMEHQRAFPN